MGLVGCTTPYGNNKSQVCKIEEDVKKAKNVYEKYRFDNNKAATNCKMPCSYLTLDAILMKERDYTKTKPGFKKISYISLRFGDTIKVLKAHFLYSTLSLIAEIGGYVGLFLGLSIYQTSELIEYACRTLKF